MSIGPRALEPTSLATPLRVAGSASARPARAEPRGAPEPRVVLVDHHDSFTHNIAHALCEAGARCEVVAHDASTAGELLATRPDGLVLGPGPCTPHEANMTLALLDRLAERAATPTLGICLGHQAIGVAFGARLRRARRPIHGRRVRLHHDGSGPLAAVPSPVQVVRYNSLVIDGDGLDPQLRITARDDDGDVMALSHRSLPLVGLQFHPESWLDGGSRAALGSWVASLQRPLARADGLVQARQR